MDEPAFYSEAFRCGTSGFARILRQVFYNVINGIVGVIHYIHNGIQRYISGFKNWFSMGINDSVIGVYCGVNVFLENIGNVWRFALKKCSQFFVAADSVCIGSANAIVRLCNNAIADFFL